MFQVEYIESNEWKTFWNQKYTYEQVTHSILASNSIVKCKE